MYGASGGHSVIDVYMVMLRKCATRSFFVFQTKLLKNRQIMQISIFCTLEFQFVFVHRLSMRGQILAPWL